MRLNYLNQKREDTIPPPLDLLARRPELRDVGIAGYLAGAAVDGAPGMPPKHVVKFNNARLQLIAAQIRAGDDISVEDLEYLREFFQYMSPRLAEFNKALVKAVRRMAGEMGRLIRGAA
jgi:hypothetical protein